MIEKDYFDFYINLILKKLDNLEKLLTSKKVPDKKDILEGDTLLDNTDLCELLGVTKRTLQRYRHKKLISYLMISGKCYYKKTEVESFFKRYPNANTTNTIRKEY